MAVIFDYILSKLRLKDSSGGGGGGTVTSVGLALPTNEFTISGSPIVGAGTLTGTWKTQTANKIFAGPASGVDAIPTFRTLVAADIAGLAGNIKSNGSVDFTGTERWVSGVNVLSISPTGLDARGATSAVKISNDGTIIYEEDIASNYISIFRPVTFLIPSASVRTLASIPVAVVASLVNYDTEIITGSVRWLTGFNAYDGITSFYFFTNGCSSNQFQIDCPTTTAPYRQRGVPVNTLLGHKDNLAVSAKIYVTTDFDSTVGTADALITLYVKQTLQL